MTKEQRERLTAWFNNLLVTYRLDYFRGRAVWGILCTIEVSNNWNFRVSVQYCQEAEQLGFNEDTKDYTELLRELREIVKEVPLSDTAQSAITYVFGGEWEEAIEALDKLRNERNEQN